MGVKRNIEVIVEPHNIDGSLPFDPSKKCITSNKRLNLNVNMDTLTIDTCSTAGCEAKNIAVHPTTRVNL